MFSHGEKVKTPLSKSKSSFKNRYKIDKNSVLAQEHEHLEEVDHEHEHNSTHEHSVDYEEEHLYYNTHTHNHKHDHYHEHAEILNHVVIHAVQ